jgi:hypothetical protein
MVATMEYGRAAQQIDRDAAARRIRLQFIRRALESAFGLTHLAVTEDAAGNTQLAQEAKTRALKTYKDFRNYLPLISDHLSGAERGECEETLDNLREALRRLE